jgi:hypothetical protein
VKSNHGRGKNLFPKKLFWTLGHVRFDGKQQPLVRLALDTALPAAKRGWLDMAEPTECCGLNAEGTEVHLFANFAGLK